MKTEPKDLEKVLESANKNEYKRGEMDEVVISFIRSSDRCWHVSAEYHEYKSYTSLAVALRRAIKRIGTRTVRSFTINGEVYLGKFEKDS